MTTSWGWLGGRGSEACKVYFCRSVSPCTVADRRQHTLFLSTQGLYRDYVDVPPYTKVPGGALGTFMWPCVIQLILFPVPHPLAGPHRPLLNLRFLRVPGCALEQEPP